MKCPHCFGDVINYRQIHANGAKVVIKQCEDCHRIPNPKQPFYPRAEVEDWETLPLLEDFTSNSEHCAVKGCTNIGTELHHFAPRHLFDDAEDWPQAYLCMEHHREWHKKTVTGAYTKRATA